MGVLNDIILKLKGESIEGHLYHNSILDTGWCEFRSSVKPCGCGLQAHNRTSGGEYPLPSRPGGVDQITQLPGVL